MANFWNRLISSPFDRDEDPDERLKRHLIEGPQLPNGRSVVPTQALDPIASGQLTPTGSYNGALHGGGSNPAIDNATPDTPAANPAIRRMVSQTSGDDGYGLEDQFSKIIAPQERYDPEGTTHQRGWVGEAGDVVNYEFPDNRSRSQVGMDEFNRERDLPADIAKSRHGKSFWNRLGSGLLHAYKEWDPKESGWGGAFDTLVGGLEGAFDPKVDAEKSKNRKLGKVWNRVTQDMTIESAQEKRKQEQIKTAHDMTKYRNDAAKPYIEAVSKKGYFTDAEVQHIKSMGVDITDPNNPDFVEREVNGKWMIRRKNEPFYARNPTLPTDTSEESRDTTITTGGKDITLPLKPGQAAQMVATAADRAEGRAERAEVREDRRAEGEAKSFDELRSEQRKWNGKRTGAAQRITQLETAIARAVEGQFDTASLDSQLAAAKSDLAEADAQLGSLDKDVKEARKPKAKTGKKKFSSADIDRVINGR